MSNRFEKYRSTEDQEISAKTPTSKKTLTKVNDGDNVSLSMAEKLKENSLDNHTVPVQLTMLPSKKKKLERLKVDLGKRSWSQLVSEMIDNLYEEMYTDD